MDIQKYIAEYTTWLKNEITFSRIGEYYEINTPFLDSANDYIQFYVKQEGSNIFFTDDGYTINSLEMDGFKMTNSRKKQLDMILCQYGVGLDGKELVLKADTKEFAPQKHAFVQCILRVNDMCLTSRSKVASYFIDDVQSFFREKEIFSVENVQFKGRSGYHHNFDFVIPRNRTKPERLCLAINKPTKTTIGNTIFVWDDTKPERKPDSTLIVLLNDTRSIGRGVENAFSNYDIRTIRWSEREKPQNIEVLSA